MASYLALAVDDLRTLRDAALVAAALAFDALEGNPESLDDRLGEIRNSPEQRRTAAALRDLIAGSGLAVPRASWSGQDPYTLRCLPQVLGSVQLALAFAEDIAQRELNAVTDNPVVFEGDEFVSGGNFHGQALALALDTLALPTQYIAAFSERRISRLLHPALNRGLPAFLTPDPGVSSGFMVPQYLAAALVNENQTLAHPASVSSLPTSADQEDFVSMGPWAGVKLRRMIENARRVVAVEWIVAGQALELRRPRVGGRGSEAALRALRTRVAPWARDRSPADDIARVADAIASGAIVREVRGEAPF
jgi:histidine ammonia-lyase